MRPDGTRLGSGHSSPDRQSWGHNWPPTCICFCVSSTVGFFTHCVAVGTRLLKCGGRAGPPPLPAHFILPRYLIKMMLWQVPLLWRQWGRGILRRRGQGVIRRLPVHRRPDFFSHSPAQGMASLGPPVQAVAPLTLGEYRDDTDPSFSRLFWPDPAFQQLFPDLASDSSKKELMGVGAA